MDRKTMQAGHDALMAAVEQIQLSIQPIEILLEGALARLPDNPGAAKVLVEEAANKLAALRGEE